MILVFLLFFCFSRKAVPENWLVLELFFYMETILTVKEHSKLEEEGKGKEYAKELFCPVKAFALVSSITEL